MRILFAIVLFAASQLALAAEPIGRIFFTFGQRAQLDQLRAQRIVASQVRDEPVPELVTFNGIVRRSDGKSAVWVNNQLLSEAELQNKQSITGTVSRNGQIILQSPQGDARMQLKVGQSAELLSGRVDEAYAIPRATAVAKAVQKAKPEPANKAGAPAQTRQPAADSATETADPEATRKPAPGQ